MANSAVKVSGLFKSYKGANGRIAALGGVSFDAAEGEIFGLIGPDGAGKTTMMRIAATLMLPDSGDVKICGFDAVRDCGQIRRIVGYMPGRFSLYQDLTIEENIAFFAKVFGVKIDDNIGLVGEIYSQIEPFKKRLAGKLSGGMKQKLALCCALIHRPKLLVLDEPTTGVDPVSRQELWDILRNMRNGGISVLVSTPYMDEAARCDKIALIANGKILKNGLAAKHRGFLSPKGLPRKGRQNVRTAEKNPRERARRERVFFRRQLPHRPERRRGGGRAGKNPAKFGGARGVGGGARNPRRLLYGA